MLEETDGIAAAVVSHVDGTAVVTMEAPIADAALEQLITDNGYKVLSID